MNNKKLKVCWISAGVSSFVSGYLAKDVDEFVYIDIDNQHPDSMRFIKDCEKAVSTEKRIQAIETLYAAGFDVAVRLSPYVPQFVDFDRLNSINCNKIIVEFLRVNHWIKKWLPLDYSEYTVKQSGYQHLPLEKKIEYLSRVTGFDEVSVCEDVTEHYEYWRECVNHNKFDCCNLRRDEKW